MHRARFELILPDFDRPETMRALDRAATGTGTERLVKLLTSCANYRYNSACDV